MALLATVVVGLVIRTAIGMSQSPNADEASLGVAALRLNHGHLVLMESNAHYLGALGVYIAAPFVALFGPTTLALRLAMDLSSAVYIVLMYALGTALFSTPAGGVRTAAVAAVFPLFAVAYTMQDLYSYGQILPLEAAILLLTVRVAWQGTRRRRDWLALGLAIGVGVWTTPLLLVVVAPCAGALLLRGSVVGWRVAGRGWGLTALGALAGVSPWIVYNLAHSAASLHALPGARIGTRVAATQVLGRAIPIFTGTLRTCGASPTLRAVVPVAAVAALLAAVLTTRRQVVHGLLGGNLTAVAPLDLVLVIAPLSLIAVTIGSFNSVSCEPRYLLPFAVPLVVAVAALMGRWSSGIVPLLMAWVVVETITIARTPYVPNATSTGALVPRDVGHLSTVLLERHLSGIYADYWLERPLLYAGGQRLRLAEYNGYVGFPGVQADVDRSPRPSWLFVAGDPAVARFETYCRSRGVGYATSRIDSLVLFTGLTSTLRPKDLGFAVDANRVPVTQSSEDTTGLDG